MAAARIDLGGGNLFTPLVVDPSMIPAITDEYQSAFAKRYFAKGRAEGKAEGRAALLTRQLTLRFGTLPPEAVAVLTAASIEDLDAIGERLLAAKTLDEALRAA